MVAGKIPETSTASQRGKSLARANAETTSHAPDQRGPFSCSSDLRYPLTDAGTVRTQPSDTGEQGKGV